jgi:enoyl-CoA hydratase/carnithine racemase
MKCDPSSALVTDLRDGIATLQLNRPQQLNVLSESVLDALQRRLDELSAEPGLRCVILAASGRAFCAEMRRAPSLE